MLSQDIPPAQRLQYPPMYPQQPPPAPVAPLHAAMPSASPQGFIPVPHGFPYHSAFPIQHGYQPVPEFQSVPSRSQPFDPAVQRPTVAPMQSRARKGPMTSVDSRQLVPIHSSPINTYGSNLGQGIPSTPIKHQASTPATPDDSRLPPKDVARKKPRRSLNSKAQVTRTTAKVTKKEPNADKPKRRRVAKGSTLSLAVSDPNPGDDEDDIPLALKRPRTVAKKDSRQPEVLNSVKAHEVHVMANETPRTPTPTLKSTDITAVAEVVRESSPRAFHVPPELEGVKQALGEDDWNEYVGMVQKVLSEEITREKFDAVTKRTFQVGNSSLRRDVERMVAEMIVGSVLEDCET